MIAVFDEMPARKLFSKNWQFRAQALQECENLTMQDPDRCLPEYMNVIQIGLKDRIASVATQALASLETVLNQVHGV